MAKLSNGYERICKSQPGTPGVKPKDVRLYQNTRKKVHLCISCAIKRRRGGKVVKLLSEGLIEERCMDCGK